LLANKAFDADERVIAPLAADRRTHPDRQTGRPADRQKVSPYRLRSIAVGRISQIRTMDTIYLPAAYLPAAMASCIWPR
jgi:hypothetical protein